MTNSCDRALAPLDYSMLRVPLVYAMHIIGQSVQKKCSLDIEFYASGKMQNV